MAVSVIPLVAPTGATIRGIDLSRPISDSNVAAIDAAYNEYGVVFFTGQSLSPQQHIAFSRRLGSLEDMRKITRHVLRGAPEIIVLSNIVENGKQIGVVDAGQYWHTDVQFLEQPSRGSILYAREVPVDGDGQTLGDTMFADQAKAYHGLPAAMKTTIASLTAINSYRGRYEKQIKNRQLEAGETASEDYIEATHPVVRRHPVTGMPCLYVSEGYTTRICGLPEDEGSDLLRQLIEHATRPEYIYTHKWQVGDLLLWDNCMMQHNAVRNYTTAHRRLMHRTTLAGDRPIPA